MEGHPIENWYMKHPVEKREALLYLKNYLLDSDESIVEGMAYGTVFFYAYQRPLCYFHCGKNTFHIGFTSGKYLKERKNFFSGERTIVKIYPVDLNKDLKLPVLKTILKEAVAFNKSKGVKKKKK